MEGRGNGEVGGRNRNEREKWEVQREVDNSKLKKSVSHNKLQRDHTRSRFAGTEILEVSEESKDRL